MAAKLLTRVCGICHDTLLYDTSVTLTCGLSHLFCRNCVDCLLVSFPPEQAMDFACPLCEGEVNWPSGGIDDFPRVSLLQDAGYLKHQLEIEHANLKRELSWKLETIDKRKSDPRINILKQKVKFGYEKHLGLLLKSAIAINKLETRIIPLRRQEINEHVYNYIGNNLKTIYEWKNSPEMYDFEVCEGLSSTVLRPQRKYFYQFSAPIKSIHMQNDRCYLLTVDSDETGSIYQVNYEKDSKPRLIAVKQEVVCMDVCNERNEFIVLLHRWENRAFRVRIEKFDQFHGSFSKFNHHNLKCLLNTRIFSVDDTYVLINNNSVLKKESTSNRLKHVFKKIDGTFSRFINNTAYFIGTNRRVTITDTEDRRYYNMIVPINTEYTSFKSEIIDRLTKGHILLSDTRYIYLLQPQTKKGFAFASEPLFGVSGIVDYVMTKKQVIFSVHVTEKVERVFLLHFDL
ncbi:unnamed protein product [Dimorphilus gyrociliatus]|uniref:RING-type domain-containing protein n=1 Tax=Dimorphilus gyrociliatus TaxID=2664684 RepID=A0A7I8VYI5_9ANNE|nr:unnamed protein product [Dimorphilus gyrociliatus]